MNPRFASFLPALSGALSAFLLIRSFGVPFDRAFMVAATVLVVVVLVSFTILQQLRKQIIRGVQQLLDQKSSSVNATVTTNSDLQEIQSNIEAREARASRLSEELTALKRVLRGMREGVITLDSQGRAKKWNRAAEEILGLREAWRDRPIIEVVRSSDFQDLIARVFGERASIQGEITLQGHARRVIEVDAIPLQSAAPEDPGVLLVLHDLSRVKRLEQVRTDFVANVSHELRTPITAIRGFAETLLEGALHSPENSRRFVEIIFRQSKRLESIIDELLLLSSLENNPAASIHFETTSIGEVLKASIKLVEHRLEEKSITLHITGDVASQIHVRIPLIEQALLNLLQNAITYSPTGSQIFVSATASSEVARIEVKDQGPGIAEVHHARLFERFYRVDRARSRKEGGTGLGLAIVKHIAQVHGGSISLKSQLGRGSSFILELPN